MQIALAALAVSALAVVPLAFGGDGRGYPRGGGGVPPRLSVPISVTSPIGKFDAVDAGTLGVVANASINGTLFMGSSVTSISLAADTNRIGWTGGLNLDNNGGLRSNAGFNTSAGGWLNNGKTWGSTTAPTVVACSGTAASITASNGTAAFQFDVGTSCTGESTAAITLPTATTGWYCNCSSTTADRMIQQKAASTTTVATVTNIVISTGAAGDFTDGADVFCSCMGY